MVSRLGARWLDERTRQSKRGTRTTHITTTPAGMQAVVKRGSAIPTASTGWLMAPEPCSDYGSHHTDNRMVVGWDL